MRDRIQRDVGLIKQLWQDVRLVWSEMLLRWVWEGTMDAAPEDQAQKKVNHEVTRISLDTGGSGPTPGTAIIITLSFSRIIEYICQM